MFKFEINFFNSRHSFASCKNVSSGNKTYEHFFLLKKRGGMKAPTANLEKDGKIKARNFDSKAKRNIAIGIIKRKWNFKVFLSKILNIKNC